MLRAFFGGLSAKQPPSPVYGQLLGIRVVAAEGGFMKNGAECFWLYGDLRRALREYCRRSQVSRSRVVRVALERFLGGEASGGFAERCLLVCELEELLGEERRIRRLQNKLLSNFVYLRGYARRVMQGGWEDSAKFRPPIANAAPNAALAIEALEGIFHNRSRIGKRIAELSLKLYPGSYDLPRFPSQPTGVRCGRRVERER